MSTVRESIEAAKLHKLDLERGIQAVVQQAIDDLMENYGLSVQSVEVNLTDKTRLQDRGIRMCVGTVDINLQPL